MDKYLIIDNKMRKFEKEYLRSIGYNLVEIPINLDVYSEISSHPDIFVAKIGAIYVFEKSLYNYLKYSKYCELLNKKNIICGDCFVKCEYPLDVAYNVCNIGKNVIHNFEYTDSKILDIIEKDNLNKININQGYSNCSIAVIDQNSAIVTDKSIARRLNEYGIDTLCIDTCNIKLLNDGKYSNMTGFIGGCMARLGDKIIVFGDLNYIDKSGAIRKYIESKGIKIKDFESQDVIDYGGIFEI